MSAKVIIIGQFAAVAVVLTLWMALGRFFGGGSLLLLAFLGAPILALSALLVLGWGLWRPRRRKLGLMLIVLLGGAGLLAASPWLGVAGDRLFFETRRGRLDALTRDILDYRRIHQMSDGLRHFKELNRELVAYSAADVDTTRPPNERSTRPVEQVLAQDSVERQRYDEFRRRLAEVKLIEFDVQPGYVAFLYDGLLDNLQGYLVVRPGHRPPPLRSELFRADLVALRSLGGGWYWFGTT